MAMASNLTARLVIGAALGLGMAGCHDSPWVATGNGSVNGFVDVLNQNGVNKIDLLFMVDNSLSMADKQKFLQEAVPLLLNHFIIPNCVDASGNPNGAQADVNGVCASGSPEFTPVGDIHIALVTTSLGGRGKPCTPGMTTNPFDDDRGELVGSLRHTGTAANGTDITYSTYANLGFLAWDAAGRAVNSAGPGLRDRVALFTTFQQMVAAAGEQGCGYESGLEGWYRFLVDPEPPSAITVVNGESAANINPPDLTVLKQRANFLRPDSIVAIIMLTDDNDCSVIDYGLGWLVADNGTPLPRPTSQCATNPNDPCCRNCQQQGDPYKACPPASADPNCSADDGDGNGPGYIGQKNNAPSLRCWQTKRRFGFDLLFSVDRYVKGLTQLTVPNRAGQQVGNPLMSYVNEPDTGVPVPAYQDLMPRSDSSLVYLAGIVGVPWQDLATQDTLDAASPNLTLMTYSQMITAQPNRWDVILGDPTASPPRAPSDPFMFESIEPRTTLGNPTNPITGQAIVDSRSTNPQATINGHEYDVNPNTLDDLQYACIFQLPSTMVRNCTDPAYNASDPTQRRGCDCKDTTTDHVTDRNRPLCQPPGGGPAGTEQYFAKAYPGSRYLQVLKAFGEQSTGGNSIVASACPKTTDPAANTTSAYGYNAAMNAIVSRLKERLGGACLDRKLATNPPCRVIEVTRPQLVPEAIGCAGPGRGPVDAVVLPTVWQTLEKARTCGVPNRPPCSPDSYTVCQIQQVDSSMYSSCLNDVQPTGSMVGYCYIDNMPWVDSETGQTMCATPGAPGCVGNPDLVARCDDNHKRILRFVSDPNYPVPAKNSTVILACQGIS
jgi:hypothetical protein